MSHRALMLGDAERGAIAALRERATARPYAEAELAKLANGFDPLDPSTRDNRIGHINDEFTIDLPVGFRVTYTLEHQPIGLCRHLSMSLDKPGTLPHPEAASWLLEAFGFTAAQGALQSRNGEALMGAAIAAGSLHLYPEHYETGRIALNFLELV